MTTDLIMRVNVRTTTTTTERTVGAWVVWGPRGWSLSFVLIGTNWLRLGSFLTNKTNVALSWQIMRDIFMNRGVCHESRFRKV